MEKKISERVATFASIETGLGAIGSLLFMLMAILYINSFFDRSGSSEIAIGRDWARAFMKALWPSFLLFFVGRGTTKLKSWAWHMNAYILPLSFIGNYLYMFFLWAGHFDIKRIDTHQRSYSFAFLIPILIFIIFEVWFFTRSKVKEQFK